jgi:type IV pilus assembly protein PilN
MFGLTKAKKTDNQIKNPSPLGNQKITQPSVISRFLSSLIKPSSQPVQQDILGVDISQNHIRIVQLTKQKEEWVLLRYVSRFVEFNSEDEEALNKAYAEQLKKIILEEKFNTENAAISIPVTSAIVEVVEIPLLKDSELAQAANNKSLWENSITLPGSLNDYSIFWQKVKEDKEKNLMSILFVASKLDEIDKYCDMVRQAGLDPLIVDVRCFALQNVLKTKNTKSASIDCFIEISGYENYAVFIYDDLPFIYDIFVADADAMAMRGAVDQIDEALINRVASQIRVAVNTFLNQSEAPGFEKINLTSTLPTFEHLLKSLKKDIVEYKIEPMLPFESVKVPNNLKDTVEADSNQSSMAIATGLATRRLDIFGYYKFVKAVTNINLLPNREEVVKNEEKKIKTQSSLSKVLGISLILGIGMLVLAQYFTFTHPSKDDVIEASNQVMQAQQELTQLTEKLSNQRHWLVDVNEMNEKLLDLSYLQKTPRGIFVVELKHLRDGKSELTVKSLDVSLVNILINEMEQKYKEVKLVEVDSDSQNRYKISKISFKIK